MKPPEFTKALYWGIVMSTSFLLCVRVLDKAIYSIYGLTYWAVAFLQHFVAFIFFYLLDRFKIGQTDEANSVQHNKDNRVHHDTLDDGRQLKIAIFKLVVCQSLLTISKCLIQHYGIERVENYIRVTDFAYVLLIIFLINRYSATKYSPAAVLTVLAVFISFNSSVAHMEHIEFKTFLLFVWPILPIVHAFHYFVAFTASRRENISDVRLAMLVSGWTSVVMLPFAVLIRIGNFVNDQDNTFDIPQLHGRYVVVTGALIFSCTFVLAKYWLIFNCNPCTFVSHILISYNVSLYFEWLVNGFEDTSLINISAGLASSAAIVVFISINAKYIRKEHLETV